MACSPATACSSNNTGEDCVDCSGATGTVTGVTAAGGVEAITGGTEAATGDIEAVVGGAGNGNAVEGVVVVATDTAVAGLSAFFPTK